MVVSGFKEEGREQGNPTLVPSEGVVLNMMMARGAFEKLLAEV